MSTNDISGELQFLRKTMLSTTVESYRHLDEIRATCDFIEEYVHALSDNKDTVSLHLGDILLSKADIIVHQVNCMGVMGAGLAKQIRAQHPGVFDAYKAFCTHADDKASLLGRALCIKVGEGRTIANCFGQLNFRRYGQHQRMTDYDALQHALGEVREFALKTGAHSVAVPFYLGCGLAGGDWSKVKAIIFQELVNQPFQLQIWKLPQT